MLANNGALCIATMLENVDRTLDMAELVNHPNIPLTYTLSSQAPNVPRIFARTVRRMYGDDLGRHIPLMKACLRNSTGKLFDALV
jgi:hypothetical protein